MAGWQNSSEVHVGESGEVYTAPSGTALPTTTLGILNTAFQGNGFHSDDGLDLTVTPNIAEFGAWQSRVPIRREAQATEILNSFALQQWNDITVPEAFGGGSISGSGQNFRYDFPTDTASLSELALVADIVDGTTVFRFVWARGNVTEPTTIKFARSETAKLPIGFKALSPAGGGSPGYFLTNDAGFVAGS
jgi:hypothetical protein